MNKNKLKNPPIIFFSFFFQALTEERMDENIKKNIKKKVRNVEVGLAKSILRWKYKKEGEIIPNDRQMENHSQQIAGQAHDVIAKRGKNIWNGLKKVYVESEKKNKEKNR